jgi:iron complex outermembrane recepter protein
VWTFLVAASSTVGRGASTANAQQLPRPADLKTLSLDALQDVMVTSVSKVEETLSEAAAAVAVITNEDLRRSGVTSLPEALRLVPGIHVARHTSNTWGVGSRGFSSVNSEKLLVLTDTRSVYTPLFSGVFWDAQDMLLDDVERIEVIRGPGAALWGSNAVNGVINVTTKSARDTQGSHAALTVGSEEQATLSARYGGRIGTDAYYRVFGKFADRDSSFVTNTIQRDDWQIGHTGVRMDWDASRTTSLTLQGEVYGGEVGRLTPSATVSGQPGPGGLLRTQTRGGNVLARWTRSPSTASNLQLRVYYDRTHRTDPSFVDDLDTIDADLQHRSALPRRQEVTWGGNYRIMSNRNESKVIFALDPPSSRDQLVSGFVQHQVQLHDSFRLTTGTKLEHNDFSGAELQPSIRASWKPAPAHAVWGAVSRATRTPTRLERDIAIDVNASMRLAGNEAFDAERLVAFEGGYRWQHSTSVFVDVAAYHNRYRGLASLELGQRITSGGRTITPIVNENLTDGRARGFEATASVAPVDWWRLTATSAGTWLDLTPHGLDLNRGRFLDGATPRHQFGLRSLLDLGNQWELDAYFRHLTSIRRLPAIASGGPGPAAYAEMDLRLEWRAAREVSLALVGQNLLHAHHAEFGSPATRGEIQRGAYASITWRR